MNNVFVGKMMAVILKGKIFLTTFKVTESELSFTQSFS